MIISYGVTKWLNIASNNFKAKIYYTIDTHVIYLYIAIDVRR